MMDSDTRREIDKNRDDDRLGKCEIVRSLVNSSETLWTQLCCVLDVDARRKNDDQWKRFSWTVPMLGCCILQIRRNFQQAFQARAAEQWVHPQIVLWERLENFDGEPHTSGDGQGNSSPNPPAFFFIALERIAQQVILAHGISDSDAKNVVRKLVSSPGWIAENRQEMRRLINDYILRRSKDGWRKKKRWSSQHVMLESLANALTPNGDGALPAELQDAVRELRAGNTI
jgi:hypothetical protein